MNKEAEQLSYFEEIEHCWITMSDGVRLSARLWLPEIAKDSNVPVIFEYIPYRKRDMVRIRDERNHAYFASQGYACIRVDMRGSGDSEGLMEDMFGPKELDDAIEVISWLAEQNWCDGNVGMMGTSWGGTSSLQAASRRPKALKAIIATCATDNRFNDDIHHMGGCLLTDTVEWGATLPAILALPPDADTVGSQWRKIWQDRLEGITFPLEDWVRNETNNQYWRWGSVNQDHQAIQCPVLAIGGWADRYSNTVMNLLAEQKNSRCWGIVGPWGHHYPDVGNPGPAIGFQQEALRWWDHWLKGKANGIDQEPKLRTWIQEAYLPADRIENRPGRWASETNWPSDNISDLNFWLCETGQLRANKVAGQNAIKVPPSINVGLASGDTGYFGRSGGLPLEQQVDDAGSLVFESAPLEDPLEILGSVKLNLSIQTNQRVSVIAVRLNEVTNEGVSSRVCYAIQNLALDESGNSITNYSPQQPQSRTIKLNNTAYRFSKGSRIRLSISSSYWPFIWPQPKPSQVLLFTSDCRLSLPIRLNQDEAKVNFSPPLSAKNSSYTTSYTPLHRSTQFDEQTGISSVVWHQPFNSVYYPDINLHFGFETKADHQLASNDLNSGSTKFEHSFKLRRDDWEVEVISTAQLVSTETAFLPTGKVRVIENGEAIFEREWAPVIPRTCS